MVIVYTVTSYLLQNITGAGKGSYQHFVITCVPIKEGSPYKIILLNTVQLTV